MKTDHVFHDPEFWHHFEKQVQSGSWKCNFPTDLLQQSLEDDAKFYTDDTIYRKRREGILQWRLKDAEWATTILGAIRELANEQTGIYSQQLQKLHILEALSDFVEHLNCFYVVAHTMASKGVKVKPLSQDSSSIHDVDKLDPVMLVGYSERFEDNAATSIWDLCVDRHVQVNPHHQAHCMWHACCTAVGSCTFCEDVRTVALHEMVCDKVSRRLQKNLNGTVSKEMWDVDVAYFEGLPREWLNKAVDLMQEMK